MLEYLEDSIYSRRELSEGGILSGYPAMHDVFSRWLVQVVIIMVTCRVLAVLGQYMHQPRVIFEIVAGIILGPSAIGRSHADNDTYNLKIFPKASLGYLQIVASIGLTLYLFLVGLELDPELIKSHYRKAGAIAVVGMVVPFALGIWISGIMYTTLNNYDQYKDVNFTSFFVFIGTAMSITAFPVLARILKEGGLMYTKAGAMVMGAAALNDALAWVLLTLAISIAQAGNLAVAGYVFLSVAAFALGLWILVRPVFLMVVEYVENLHDPKMDNNLFALTLILVFLAAWTTQLLGVHAIFGSFLFGLIVPRNSHLFQECNEKIEELVLTVTLPIYFALSGIKTDITTISSKEEGAMVVLVCFIATIGKFIGAGLTARIGGMTNRESMVVGILMNTRGLVELIVLNLGMDAGILSIKTFSVMVIMCLFTTFITSPLVDYAYPYEIRQQELKEQRDAEENIRRLKAHVEGAGDEDYEAEPREADYRLETAASKVRITIVVDCLEHLQGFLDLTYHLMPLKPASSLSALLLKFNEPSYTMKDQFLGLTPDGRLILVEPEVTDLIEALALSAASKKPQLLPLSMQLKSIGVSQVQAFNVMGNPDEYPTELASLSGRAASDFIFFPWRPAVYTQTFFNAALLAADRPMALVAQLNVAVQTVPEGRARAGTLYAPKSGKPRSNTTDTDGSDIRGSNASPVKFDASIDRSQKDVLVLITGKPVDLSIFPLALRFAENLSTQITVLVPQDRKTFAQKNREFFLDFKAIAKTMPNITIEVVSAISTDINGLISCIFSSTFDTFIGAFEPCVTDSSWSLSTPPLGPVLEDAETGERESMVRAGSVRNRSKSITELNDAIEELGAYGSAIYTKQLASTLIVFHEEKCARKKSVSQHHGRTKSDASDDAMRAAAVAARDSVNIEMVTIKN